MAEIRVADTTIEVEESYDMHGMITLRIQRYDPYATMTSFQARQVASALMEAANEADGFE